MYHGFRSHDSDNAGNMVWKFYDGKLPEGQDKSPREAVPYEQITIPMPADRETRDAIWEAVIDLGDQCWQQGRASAHAEHEADAATIASDREELSRRWATLQALDRKLKLVEALAVGAWMEGRMISPDELRDVVMAKP